MYEPDTTVIRSSETGRIWGIAIDLENGEEVVHVTEIAQPWPTERSLEAFRQHMAWPTVHGYTKVAIDKAIKADPVFKAALEWYDAVMDTGANQPRGTYARKMIAAVESTGLRKRMRQVPRSGWADE